MFITSSRNIILPSQDGTQRVTLRRGFVGNIPDWAAKTPYFAALVKDGKIVAPKSKKDKDLRGPEKPKLPANPGQGQKPEGKEQEEKEA